MSGEIARTRRLRPSVVLALALALAAALAACGSDDTSSDRDEAAPTTDPAATAGAPESTTAEPESTTNQPESTTAEPEPTTTAPPPETTTTAPPTTEPPTTTQSRPPETTTTAAAEDPARLIEIEVVGGEITGGARTERIELGEQVTIRVSGDSSDEVHVHGYDLFIHLSDGEGELSFTADIPGVFEVELEGAHQLLINLQVS